MTDNPDSLTGRCGCGGVRYSLAAAPLTVAVCHCESCRRQSGAAFSVNLIVRASAMSLEGALGEFLDHDTESGSPLMRQFCRLCGSPIRSVPSANPKIVAVKAGTLDQAGDYPPAMHLWVRSKLPWVAIPEELPQFETGGQP